jgi:hypothetical protein
VSELQRGAQKRIAAAVIEAMDRQSLFCSEAASLVRYRGRVPWRAARKKSWWEIEIENREWRRIREMIGPGKFVFAQDDKGRDIGPIVALEVEASMQPATPQEHDIFEAIAKHHDGDITAVVLLSVENGMLKANFRIPVPEMEPVNPANHPDGRVGIVLKADADAARAAAAQAADDAEKKLLKRDKEIAVEAATAKQTSDDRVAEIAAEAGAAAAAGVVERLKDQHVAGQVQESKGN